jgi:hypothetical protein
MTAGVLASYAGPDGRCWPGVRALADDMGLSVRSARHHVNTLIAQGFVVVANPERVRGQLRVLICTWIPGAEVIHKCAGDPRTPPEQSARLDGPSARLGGHEVRGSAAQNKPRNRPQETDALSCLYREDWAEGTAPSAMGRALIAEARAALERHPAGRWRRRINPAGTLPPPRRTATAMDGDTGEGVSDALRAV